MRSKMLALTTAVLVLVSCVANPDTGENEPHWPTIAREAELAIQDLYDAAVILDPEKAERLAPAFGAAATAARALAAIGTDGELADPLALVDQALAALEAIVRDEGLPDGVRAGAVALRGVLRRARFSLTQPEPIPGPPGG